MKNTKLISFIILVGSLIFLAAPAFAVNEKSKEITKSKTMTGKIMGKTRQNISVEFDSKGNETFEALIPFDSKTKLAGYKKFSDIQENDIVRVELVQSYQVDAEDKEVKTGTLAASITMIRSNTSGKLTSRER